MVDEIFCEDELDFIRVRTVMDGACAEWSETGGECTRLQVLLPGAADSIRCCVRHEEWRVVAPAEKQKELRVMQSKKAFCM